MITAVIADDEPIIRMDLCDMVSNIGIDVVGQASDGFDVVEVCSKSNPDVVLMDIKMPVFDGLSAAKKIIDDSLAGCVVLVTAFCDKDFIESAKEIGVTGYLVKPIEERLLKPTIEIALNQSKMLSKARVNEQKAKDKLLEKNIIDRAKMLVAKKESISEGDAYAYLQKMAMKRRLSMAQVSKIIVDMSENKELSRAKELVANKYKISQELAFKKIKQYSENKKLDITTASKEIIRKIESLQEAFI